MLFCYQYLKLNTTISYTIKIFSKLWAVAEKWHVAPNIVNLNFGKPPFIARWLDPDPLPVKLNVICGGSCLQLHAVCCYIRVFVCLYIRVMCASVEHD